MIDSLTDEWARLLYLRDDTPRIFLSDKYRKRNQRALRRAVSVSRVRSQSWSNFSSVMP